MSETSFSPIVIPENNRLGVLKRMLEKFEKQADKMKK
jgi:hypothetical protein